MKKTVVLLLLLSGAGIIAKAQTGDFRGFDWGNSLANVQQNEKAQLVVKVSDDELLYKDALGGADCDVYYIFNDNDKLESGMYVFTKKYRNPELYVQDYLTYRNLLSQRYGKPATDKENWSKNSKPAERHNYGQAVADGDLAMHATWNTPRSLVKIILINSADKHPVLQIHYTTLNPGELQNKDDLKAALKKL